MFRLDSILAVIFVPARLEKFLRFLQDLESPLQIAIPMHGQEIRLAIEPHARLGDSHHASLTTLAQTKRPSST